MLLGMLSLAIAALWGQSNPVKFDTELVRVLDVTNTPGQKSRLHRHTVNRVMVHLDAGKMRLSYEDGSKQDLSWRRGQVRWDPAGGMHTSENTGGGGFRIVEVEIKKPGAGTAVFGELDPVKVAPKQYRVEMENEQVRVVRARLSGNEAVPLHEHRLPRVVVFLTDYRLQVTSEDGKVMDVAGKAGDIAMPGPARHSERNLSTSSFEVIAVELKRDFPN